MITLLLRPRETSDRSAVASLADALRAGSGESTGLAAVELAGPETQRRVECSSTNPVALVGLLLAVIRAGAWAAALVVQPGESPLRPEQSASPLDNATADTVLRRAAESSGRCAVEVVGRPTTEAATVESALQLLGVLERRRSEHQQAAGRLVEAGASQREAAADLAISQQAVHDRLKNGLWHETRRLAATVAASLATLDRTRLD